MSNSDKKLAYDLSKKFVAYIEAKYGRKSKVYVHFPKEKSGLPLYDDEVTDRMYKELIDKPITTSI